MKIYAMLALAALISPCLWGYARADCSSYPAAVFCEDFNTAPAGSPICYGTNTRYNFDSCVFGYSDNRIYPTHDATGGIGGSGASKIPIFGLTGNACNFEIHWGTSATNGLSAYYARGCWKVNSAFPHDPAQNWKLSYNYVTSGVNYVTWMRPMAGGDGFQPCFYDATADYDQCKTNSQVSTFYIRDHKNEWVCIEWYANPSTDTVKMWLSTEDHEYFDTLYTDASYNLASGPHSSFKIGSYWDGCEFENAYFWLDEVVISTSKIGPPTEWSGTPTYECSDSIDNDGDGHTDYPSDAGCTSSTDMDETNCGDSRCEGGETCSSCSQDCGTCASCGDGTCSSGETCLQDSCCNGQSYSTSTQVCCSSQVYTGNCCSNSDCTSPQVCTNHICMAQSSCGDGSCNGSETCSSCPNDCGSCPTGQYLFYDNFSTDTTGTYTWTHTSTEGGLGSHSWDSQGQRLSVLTQDNVGEKFSHTFSPTTAGTFSIKFSPGTSYPSQGMITIRLMQDSQNYYEFRKATDRLAPVLNKTVNGIVADNSYGAGYYATGTTYTINITFSPDSVSMAGIGNAMTINTNHDPIQVNYFEIELYQQDSYFDDISLTVAFHKSDTDQDGCVSDTELFTFIALWQLDSSNPTLRELMEAIGLWKRGGCA